MVEDRARGAYIRWGLGIVAVVLIAVLGYFARDVVGTVKANQVTVIRLEERDKATSIWLQEIRDELRAINTKLDKRLPPLRR